MKNPPNRRSSTGLTCHRVVREFGITRIRTHVYSIYPDLTTVEALVELRDELTVVDDTIATLLTYTLE